MIYTIKNDIYEAKIESAGAELVSLVRDGRECVWQGDNRYWGGRAPLLFPFCGGVNNKEYTYCGKKYSMGNHGFAKKMEFQIVNKSDTKLVFSLKSSPETLAIYPFDFELIAEYELAGEELLFNATVKNTGDKTLPYMFGWHPGFMMMTDGGADINDYYVDFGSLAELDILPLENSSPFTESEPQKYSLTNGKVRINEDYLYPRDTLIFLNHENKCVMGTEKNSHKVSVSWTEKTPVLCLWKAEFNEAKFLCIEPWTQVTHYSEKDKPLEDRKIEKLQKGEEKTYSYATKITF